MEIRYHLEYMVVLQPIMVKKKKGKKNSWYLVYEKKKQIWKDKPSTQTNENIFDDKAWDQCKKT